MDLLLKWRAEIASGPVRVMFQGRMPPTLGGCQRLWLESAQSKSRCRSQIDQAATNLLWRARLSDQEFCGA